MYADITSSYGNTEGRTTPWSKCAYKYTKTQTHLYLLLVDEALLTLLQFKKTDDYFKWNKI